MVEGGIDRYVYSIDGGKTWINCELYNRTSINSAPDNYLNAAIGNRGANYTFADKEASRVNAIYQCGAGSGANCSGVMADLSVYGGRTLDVIFAAVPTAEPNSVCPLVKIVGVKTANPHEYRESYTDNEDNTRTYSYFCSHCNDTKYSYTIQLGNTKPNVIVTAGTLAQMKGAKANMGEAILADDGSYVRFNSSTTASEGYFMPYVGDGTVTGQYMAVRYRTTQGKSWEFFVGANNGQSGFAAGDNFYVGVQTTGQIKGGIIADGEWRTVIFDLSKLRSERFLAEDDGTYIADYIRWDIFNEGNGQGSAAYVDVAYVAFADDLKKLADMTDINGYIYAESTWVGGDSKTYSVGLPMSGEIDNPFMDASWIQIKKGSTYAKTNVDSEHNDMQYVTLTQYDVTSSSYIFSQVDHKVINSGNYIGLIYRKSEDCNAEDYIAMYINSTQNGAAGGTNTGKTVKLECDGEWHIWLVDISTTAYDPETGLASIRFDYFNKAESAGETVDIAFIATYDSVEQANEHFAAWNEYYGLNIAELAEQ